MVKGTWIVLGVLAAIALVAIGAVGSAVSTYNKLTTEDEGVVAQGEIVDVAYQRAFRLLPRIENISTTYMRSEADVQTKVAALRSLITESSDGSLQRKDAVQEQLVETVLLVGGRAEAYPDLQASGLMASLMIEVTNTENKIAAEKLRYNDLARDYNAHRRQCCIPVLVAGMFGFEPHEYIGIADRPNQSTFPEGEQV